MRAAAEQPASPPAPRLGGWTSSLDRVDHAAACAQVLELLRAGECYQVNVTRRLAARRRARSDRALRRARRAPTPRRTPRCCTFGARSPALAVVSASPELFLRIEPAATAAACRDPADQGHRGRSRRRSRASAKDHAENVMIVDLARNDLGRVCEFGSVRGAGAVRDRGAPRPLPPREHRAPAGCGPTSTSPTSSARRSRPRRSPARRSRACMQAIEDLEPVRRGVYCGAIGWIDGDRGARRARGRDPHVHDRGRAHVPRRRRRHRRRLAARRRVGRDRAEGRAPARGGRLRRRRRSPRDRRRCARDRLDQRRRSSPLETRGVSPLDHGLVVGDGVFETLRVYGGVPFAWTRHLARLARVGRRASGSPPPTPTSCAPRPTRCSRRTASREARLRITVTGGPAPPGSRRGAGAAHRVRRRRSRSSRPPPTADGRDRAVDAQRGRRARRAEDDLLRRERARARVRRGARRATKRSSPTRGATCARRPARTCSSCSTARAALPRCRPAASSA